jgi:Ser/Thr protein kinase RdoA (MazF antagonist)
MYENILPRVLNAYDIKYRNIFDCQSGYRNEIWPVLDENNRMINVTFYKSEVGIIDRIKRANAVSEYLAQRGMSTRKRIDPRTLVLKSGDFVVNVNVYNYLPGSTIPWEAYTMEYIKALGATMGNMHALLADMSVRDFPSVYDEYEVIVNRMREYFARPNIQKAAADKLNLHVGEIDFGEYIKLLCQYRRLPNQQVLHMDFVRGNVLFEDEKISGVIDFEKTSAGHAVVDIARTLAFLLVDCKYKTARQVSKYFLHSGCQKRGQNSDIGNRTDRNRFVEMFLLYDLYKFMLHNPYEALELNEHYTRTRDILVKFGVLLYKITR